MTALQLFTLGVPCLYYGTEQGLASGAEPEERQYLNWGGHDCLLREAMFGPEHPRASGWDGTQAVIDNAATGFGPHGTAGWHVFNTNHPVYQRLGQLTRLRKLFTPLRRGRQYQRQIAYLGYPFDFPGTGQIMAWSRIFDDQEVLVVINSHGAGRRGGRVVIDRNLSGNGMQVVLNTDPTARATMQAGAWVDIASQEPWSFVGLDQWLLGPSEVLVLANREACETAGLKWLGPN